MKVLNLLAILVFLASCKDAKKADYKEISETSNTDLVQTDAEHPGKIFMETACYICHDATTPEENRLAPPMAAVKRRYLMGDKTKDEFINDILVWSKKPSLEKSKMPGAVDRFGVMPYLPYPEENIKLIAEYLYDYETDQPAWFEEHYQKNHDRGQGMGKGQGQGKGMGKGQGNNMGKGKRQRMGQTASNDNYSAIGLKYVLSTKAQLGKNLQKAIQEKGAVGAVEFCNLKAMMLTDSMSVMHNAIIKRVSDKPRNPTNLANAKELGHIAAFKQLFKTGSTIEPIVEEINGEINFYYPITTNTMCLQCHGTPKEQVTSATFSALNKLYPEDKATGYEEGQVRGIWSINFEASSFE